MGVSKQDLEAMMVAARGGDELAKAALKDEMEELGEEGRRAMGLGDGGMSPYRTGEKYLVCLTTLYYVGRVVAQGMGWIRMEGASWVHWTGRLSTLIRHGFRGANGTWPEGEYRPRTEYVDKVIVHYGPQGASSYDWDHDLPSDSIQ